MASASNVLRTFSLLLYLTFHVHTSPVKTTDFFLDSLKVGSVKCDNNTCKYLLNVSGVDFLGSYPWRLTPEKGAKGGSCEIIYSNYEIKEIETLKLFSKLEVFVPNVDGRIYFCIQQKTKNNAPFSGEWVHQGVDHYLELKNDVSTNQELQVTPDSEPKPSEGQEADTQAQQTLEGDENNMQEANVKWKDLTHDIDVNYLPNGPRSTRDNKEDVEVLVQKQVPHDDIVGLKIYSDEALDRSSNELIDFNRAVDNNNFAKVVQDDEDQKTINEAPKKDSVYNKFESLESTLNHSENRNDEEEKFDEIKAFLVQSSQLAAKLAVTKEKMDKFKKFPSYTTIQEIAVKYFPNDDNLQEEIAYLGCSIMNLTTPCQTANLTPKKSLQEILRNTNNERNKVINSVTVNDEIENKEKEFDEGLNALTSLITQSALFNAKLVEMKLMMKKFDDLSTYTTIREIAAKVLPNDELLKKEVAASLKKCKSLPQIHLGIMDPIMLILRTDKIDELTPEIKLIIKEVISAIPNYNPTFQQLAAKCFPNYGCVQLVIAIPHTKFKTLLEVSSKEVWWFIGNEQRDAESTVSMENVKGAFGKEFDDLLAVIQSSENDTNVAEIQNAMDQINARPFATTLRKILRKCIPGHGCVKVKMTALRQIAKSSLKKSFQEIVRDITKDKKEVKNLTPNVKFDDTKDKEEELDKGLNALTSLIIQSSVFKAKMAEMKQMMEKFEVPPSYQTLQEIARKYSPNDEQTLKAGLPKPENFFEKLFSCIFTAELNKIGATKSDMTHIDDKTNDLSSDGLEIMAESHFTNDGLVMAESRPLKSHIFRHETSQKLVPKLRRKRQMMPDDFTSVRADVRPVVIEGIRIEDSAKEPKIIEDGIPSVLAESAVTLRVFGEGLSPDTVIAFTHDPQPYGQPCKFLLKGEYTVKEGSLKFKTALFEIRTPAPITANKLYICAKNLQPGFTDPNEDEGKYLHQGTDSWKMLASHNKLLPLWVSICLILFCLMFSALFSGLNLGLMSLDRTELKIIANTGTEQERKYARAIMPVRDHGNYLLCSILLGNVAVNSTFTILLDELTSGLFAVIFSTLAIVMLGEITPQAICSRHGLMVGAKSIVVTKGVMAVTAPLSFPVSKLLDYFLGEEIGNVYNRERLKELVKVTTDVNDLDKEEVNIISGALEMRKKTVSDVMTKLEDVFMLPITSVLDFETMSEIVKSGYSRIPVYEGHRGNIVTVLFIKDLAFVDPDDNTPLRTLCQYYQNAAHFVFEDVTLDVMFKQFKDGHKGHMAFVHRINNEGEGDPFYETIGLVTLEDVIEEMIQSEIVDETDVFLDNRSKRRRRPQNKLQDFAAFAERHENQRIHISPQLTLATFQFLSTSVDAFRPDMVSETVLRRLLKQDVIQYIKIKGKTKKDACTYVFQQGKPVDYFVLILEGRVEVTVGRENLVFEAGPFTYFGVQALTQNIGVAESPTPSAMGSLQNINMDAMLRHTFVPDYSVRAITSVYYLTVKRSLYLAAKRATLMEKGNISKGGTTQEFDTEVDKLLQSVDEDLSITGEHKTPSRQVSPNPMPVSPAPRTNDSRNGNPYVPGTTDEEERLLK